MESAPLVSLVATRQSPVFGRQQIRKVAQCRPFWQPRGGGRRQVPARGSPLLSAVSAYHHGRRLGRPARPGCGWITGPSALVSQPPFASMVPFESSSRRRGVSLPCSQSVQAQPASGCPTRERVNVALTTARGRLQDWPWPKYCRLGNFLKMLAAKNKLSPATFHSQMLFPHL